MDFVAKKAFQSKVKRFGEELGVNQIFSEASSSDNHNRNDGERNDGVAESDFAESSQGIAPSVQAYFEGQPRNFPVGLRLFYVDRGILELGTAYRSVTCAYRLLVFVSACVVLNAINRVLLTVFDGTTFSWVYALLAVLFGCVMVLGQLLAYETSFRGAYLAKKQLRLRYLLGCAATLAMVVLYTFVDAAWFNGWFQLQALRGHEFKPGYKKPVVMVSTVCEALGWTGVLFYGMFTLFDYYHLYSSGNQGLSSEALVRARSSSGAGGSQRERQRQGDASGGGGGGGGRRSDRERAEREARIEEIRQKYSTST